MLLQRAQAALCFCLSLTSSVQHLTRPGAHQTIEVSVLREGVGERHELPAAADQAAAGGDIGDVAELGVRDGQQLGQFLAVSGALVEQDQKFRVCQHQAGGVGAQQLVHILSQAGDQAVIFADTLPQFIEKVGAVLIAEEDIKLIRHNPGTLAALLILNDPVIDSVQRHQHPQRHELFAQFADIIVDDAGLGIHVGVLGKGVQGARDKQLTGQRQSLSLRFRLHLEQAVKVPQRRRRALVAVADVGLVDQFGASSQNGFFLGRHLPAADQLFIQREYKLALGDDGIALVAVTAIHVQRVDVGVGCGRDLDDLAAQRAGQVAELRLRVEDQDIILGCQRDLHQFLLGTHRLAGTRHAQTEAVAIQQFGAIGHDHVLADGILPVVDAARLQDLLGAERD